MTNWPVCVFYCVNENHFNCFKVYLIATNTLIHFSCFKMVSIKYTRISAGYQCDTFDNHIYSMYEIVVDPRDHNW